MVVYTGTIKKRFRKKKFRPSLKQKVKKIVKKEMSKNEEYKYNAINGNTDPTTTATITCLTEFGQGTDVESREGNEVIGKSLDLRYMLTPATTPLYPTYVRCIILRDTEGANGNDPTCITNVPATDVILNGGGVNTYNFVVQKNQAIKSRYVILYDKVHRISATGPDGYYREYYKKINNQKVKWFADGATDRQKGHLWFIYFSNQAAGGNAPTIQWYSLFKFTESS